ncbi:MAG: ATP-dependent helicase UvrD/PcrA, partial [Solirubrobacteraceae bacterium]|nr:ATP-dependent helicase UvrD/PcrA [Solirubrobacteraceae bacterium]
LLAADHRRLTVLGDPRQAICAYRGATSAENFAAFATEFHDTATVTLRRNYRSTPPILAAANQLAAPLPDGPTTGLWTATQHGDAVVIVAPDDEAGEAAAIVAWARANDGDGTRAVLVRVNDQIAPIEQVLLRAGVRTAVFGATQFAARAEIRNALAALAVAANPRDRLAFARMAAAAGRGVGPGACRALFTHGDANPGGSLLDHAARGDIAGLTARQSRALRGLCAPLIAARDALEEQPAAVAEHVTAVLVASGQPDRLKRTAGGGAGAPTRWRAQRQLRNLRALVTQARAYERRTQDPRLADFLARIALAGDDRAIGGDAVALSTIHRAKGLEFHHVWVAGAEEGRLPHGRALREDGEPEERRLAYVAVTRAKRTLHVSWVAKRGGRRCEQSRYLAAIVDSWGQTARDSIGPPAPTLHQSRTSLVRKGSDVPR